MEQQATTNENSKANNNGFLCRQSSSRWTPTTDQIRILKELYYTNGMRSPSADQIQRISARLRQYGKIEGKNVFYWFQNHKARERQKKRFTTTSSSTSTTHNHDHLHVHNNINNHNHSNVNHVLQRNNLIIGATTNTTVTATNSAWKPHHDHHHHQAFHHNAHLKYSHNLSPVVSCGNPSSASSVVGINGQMGNYPYAYGGIANMDKAFREQCGSTSGANGGSIAHNFGNWVGSVDPYSSSPYAIFDRRSSTIPLDIDVDNEDDDQIENGDHHDDEDDQASPEIETLPLFPMHGEEINAGGYYSGWYPSDHDGVAAGRGHVTSRTSLELSLNSYGHRSSPDSLI